MKQHRADMKVKDDELKKLQESLSAAEAQH